MEFQCAHITHQLIVQHVGFFCFVFCYLPTHPPCVFFLPNSMWYKMFIKRKCEGKKTNVIPRTVYNACICNDWFSEPFPVFLVSFFYYFFWNLKLSSWSLIFFLKTTSGLCSKATGIFSSLSCRTLVSFLYF